MCPISTHKFPGRYDSLEKIDSVVRQAAESINLEPSAVYAVETAVDEACSNIIEHAYGGEGKGEIELIIESSEKALTVILRDHGRPFDPSTIPTPNLKAPVKKRKENGLGYYMMCCWMDEVKFSFTDEYNQLTMIKYKHKEG